jgi:hypothetical protein
LSNFGSNNVVKVRTSDGSILGTFAVGTNPIAVAYDSGNVWVANINSNNVTQLNGNTGAVLGTFSVGTKPAGLAFDGTNIGVANNGSNNVTQLAASPGAAKGTFAVTTNPAGILFDGTNIWVADHGNASVTNQRHDIRYFPRRKRTDGQRFWRNDIWTANFGSNDVTKLSLTGTVLGTFNAGLGPNGVAYDGSNIWVTDFNGAAATKLKASSGATLNTFTVGKGAG